MKNIEIDDELYQFIVTKTQFIGENASSILRRLLNVSADSVLAPAVIETFEVPEKSELPQHEVIINDDVETVKSIDVSNASKEAQNKTSNKTISAKVIKTPHSESVFNFINKEELAMQRGAVGRFLLILAALYRAHPDDFYVVNDICGRDRLYFASSKQELTASGSSTNPRQIGQSPYWVITNSNTTRKKMILTKVATFLGYPESHVEEIRELL